MSATLTAPNPSPKPNTADQAGFAVELDVVRRRYLRNLQALYRQDPELAARIEALPFANLPELESTREPAATVRVNADDGCELLVHSRFQPLTEAARFVAALENVENPSFFMAGLGLGYPLLELDRKYRRAVFLVSEPDLRLIKCALCAADFSELFAAGRLIFFTRADKGQIHERLSVCNADLMLGIQFIVLPHARRCHTAEHAAIRDLLMEFIAYSKMQMVTLLKTSRTTVQNVAANLPHYLLTPGVEALKDRARGYPAIIVAAGPSLARNIEQIAALRGRAVIIAVQTIYKLLRDLGIQPHFVTSLDYHAVSAEYFHDVKEPGDTMLVAEPKATWHVLDAFRGGRIVLHHDTYDELLQGAGPRHDVLKAGSTVAHLSFYLAAHLGCDPIIFIGQDLAYSEGLYYLPGTPFERIWQPELGRFNTMEMRQLERVTRFRPILKRIRDIHGRDTYTDEMLASYSEQFEADFQRAAVRIIQATEGGAALRGAEVMSLRQAAKSFCTRDLPAGIFDMQPPTDAAAMFERAQDAMRQRQTELETVRGISTEMAELLDRLPALLDRPNEFNRLIVRVDELRLLMQRHGRMYKLVISVSQQAELRRHSADRRMGDTADNGVASAKLRIARDREFVAAFLDGCEFLAGVLRDSMQRLNQFAGGGSQP